MSYFDRLAKRMPWSEAEHPRGKTTTESRGGSFKPKRSTAPDPANLEVQRTLTETKQMGYALLSSGRVNDPVTLRARLQEHYREWMGPGYEAQVDQVSQLVWEAYAKRPSEYHEPREWMGGVGPSSLSTPITRRLFEQLNKIHADIDAEIFKPHLPGMIAKRGNFNEADHPRGKTVLGTNDGSFSPAGSRGAESMNVQEMTFPQIAEREFSSHIGQRHYRQMNTPVLDAEVQASDTPSQTLKAQFGTFPTEQEILNIVRENVGQEAWQSYLDAEQRMNEALAKTGVSRDHYATPREITEPDGTVKTVYDYDEDRVRDVHGPVYAKYLDRYDELAARTGDRPPELIILGGRGGSGKSAFGPDPETGQATEWNFAFYGNDAVVIDPDDIKRDLAAAAKATGRYALDHTWDPSTDGSTYFHEESSDLSKRLLEKMRERAASGVRANVVLDLTLASNKLSEVQQWKGYGYFTTLTNINVPVADSATNALKRFLTGGKGRSNGRLVPIRLIANSRDNEKNFDSMINATDGEGNHWVDHWEVFTAGTRQHRNVATGGRPRPARST